MDVTHVHIHWSCPFSFYHELLQQTGKNISSSHRTMSIIDNKHFISKIMCETMRKIPMCLRLTRFLSISLTLPAIHISIVDILWSIK